MTELDEIAALWAELDRQRRECHAYADRLAADMPPDVRDRCFAEVERQIKPLAQRLAELEALHAVRKAKAE